MADWFESNSAGGSGGETGGKPESGSPETPASPAGQESGGWSSPAPDAQTGSTASSGGDGADAPYSPWPSAGTPSSAQSPSGGWQAAPQRPAPSYNPYGWQPPAYTPAPMPGNSSKPPKKKRNGPGILIGVLGGLCAVTIIALSVLLALAWDGGINLSAAGGNSTGGGNPASSFHNGDAPKIQINELDEDTQGKSTREIVKMNLESTVILSMYMNQSGYGIGEQQAGEASGIVMTADGYIITNWHCVVNEDSGQPYSRIAVTMHDGTTFDEAQIIGYDQSTDLAVIRVAAMNLKPAEFGDSSQLDIGDKVVALGNAAGQVVAVNSAKIAIAGYEGLGFSIPIAEAQDIVNDLIQYGYVTGRVSLGIKGYTVNQANYKGFLIDSIVSGSPLEGTGAQKGDLITHVDGVRVNSYGELRGELSKHSVGDTVTLTILRVENRRDSTFTIQIKLAEDKGR